MCFKLGRMFVESILCVPSLHVGSDLVCPASLKQRQVAKIMGAPIITNALEMVERGIGAEQYAATACAHFQTKVDVLIRIFVSFVQSTNRPIEISVDQ